MAASLIDLHRRYNDDVINQGNLDLVDELFTPDYVDHTPPGPDLQGRDGIRQFVTMLRSAFPDAHFTVEDRIVEGNTLVARWTMRGTHQGEFAGVPATGKPVVLTGIAIHRFGDDQIQESWDYYDALGLLQQLGAIPAPQSAGA